ncbi:MAG: SPFH domain-containing protein [Limnohabitans sp.]|jgi:membrane protease subunit HflC|nr:SPFH domain-containing protein [Limnohabitans sp.]
MNKRSSAIALGIAIVAVLVLYSTTYTVNFHEIAIRTRFGVPAGVERDPGLHFKFPFFVDNVTKIDRRKQLVESPLVQTSTRDGLQVVVQAYLFWQVTDGDDGAQKFFQSYGGSLEDASKDLEQALAGAVKAVAGFNFDELVGPKARLADAETAILSGVNNAAKTGIAPVSVGLAQVVLPQKTTVSVLSRMAEVQNTLARLETAKASSQAEALKSQANSQADTIRAFAAQWAARIEAKGNEEAAVYYERMTKHADLATFLAWIDALRAGLRGSTTFVGDTTTAPFHLLDLSTPVDSKGVPRPSETQSSADEHGSKGEDRR